MIIEGNSGGNVGFWTKHLQRDDTNERAELIEIRGLLSDNLGDGLKEMKAIADQSRCKGNFLYQANINPAEPLTPEQWARAIDALEQKLGLAGHQRIIYEHEKIGEDGAARVHRHILWNRVDVDTLRVTDMGQNWLKQMAVARELEAEFDHTPTPRPPAAERKPVIQLWEHREGERTGIKPEAVREEVTALWRESTTGQGFKEAIEGRGYVLAAGDRRDFCVVDYAGTVHSLARRLDGVKAKEVRDHMADVDRAALPTVYEAQQMQRERAPVQHIDPFAAPIRTTAPTIEVTADQLAAREAKADRVQEAWREKREAEVERVTGRPNRHQSTMLGVADHATGMAVPLVDFVLGLFAGGHVPQEPQTPAAEIKAHHKAVAALERIHESMERGENLRPDDLRGLTPTHLENIRARGDDYLRQLIEDLQQEEVRRQQRELER